MTLLQQPVLFASDPSSNLVGLGLILTITAVLFVASVVLAFALSSREVTPKKSCEKQPEGRQTSPASTIGRCGEAVTS